MTIGKHSIEAWRLLVIVAAIIFPAVVVAWSSAHAFPDSAAMAVMISITAVFCAFLIEAKIDSEHATLRQAGIALIILLGGGGVAGTILHGQLTRDISKAKAAWPAYEKEHKEWEKSVEGAKAKSSQRLVSENTSYSDALARWETAAARAKRLGIDPPPYPKDSSTGKDEQDEIASQAKPIRPETEAEARDKWAAYNFWQQGIELFVAVFGLTLMSAIKHWDKPEPKKPEEIAAIAKTMPESEFAARYPDQYRHFYPNGTMLDKAQPQAASESPALPSPSLKIGFAAPVKDPVPIPSKTPVPTPVKLPSKTPVLDPGMPGTLNGNGNGNAERERKTEIQGVSLPVVKGTRWRPNNRDESAECLIYPKPKRGIGYLGGLSKNKLSDLKSLPESERFDLIRAEVHQWLSDKQNKQGKSLTSAPIERS